MNLHELPTNLTSATQNATTLNLNLNDISYEWVDKTKNPLLLKQALELLKNDGNHFKDLQYYIQNTINSLNPKNSSELFNENLNKTDAKKKAIQEISDWVVVDSDNKNNSNNKLLSENEKNKGNDALRANDIDEAIGHYTKAVELYSGNFY